MWDIESMNLDCPPEMFKKLSAKVNSQFVAESEEEMDFLYKALAECGEPSGVMRIHIPKITNDALTSWDNFEYWLEDIDPLLNLDSLGSYVDADLYSVEQSPRRYFGYMRELETLVVKALCSLTPDGMWIACVEQGEDKKSLLICYEDLDAWALGHATDVLVLENPEKLSEDNGFYSLESSTR